MTNKWMLGTALAAVLAASSASAQSDFGDCDIAGMSNEEFLALDENGDTGLSMDEYIDCLDDRGITLSDEAMDDYNTLFAEADRNTDGTLMYPELEVYVARAKPPRAETADETPAQTAEAPAGGDAPEGEAADQPAAPASAAEAATDQGAAGNEQAAAVDRPDPGVEEPAAAPSDTAGQEPAAAPSTDADAADAAPPAGDTAQATATPPREAGTAADRQTAATEAAAAAAAPAGTGPASEEAPQSAEADTPAEEATEAGATDASGEEQARTGEPDRPAEAPAPTDEANAASSESPQPSDADAGAGEGAAAAAGADTASVEDEVATISTVPYQINVSALEGADVMNSAGEEVGEVHAVLLDPATDAPVVIIAVGGVLGIGEKELAFPYGDLTITSSAVVLNTDMSQSDIEAMDEYDADAYQELPETMIVK
ncbi:hypothetical protein DLJ53_08895 [Acuticoccus sediminis]|uniref:EF-hand domain-containing protein n=1 Tax=Acuticoccus sediminis TaxID=2184697 RepID=A0A8B2NVI2_9HYPH|nr:PRC-barrel domain-containing protein [Acuticoccus sediminis]RAI01534.1 hypothetical protein DLJ53_08895 [Acuticoccus sediminis]